MRPASRGPLAHPTIPPTWMRKREACSRLPPRIARRRLQSQPDWLPSLRRPLGETSSATRPREVRKCRAVALTSHRAPSTLALGCTYRRQPAPFRQQSLGVLAPGPSSPSCRSRHRYLPARAVLISAQDAGGDCGDSPPMPQAPRRLPAPLEHAHMAPEAVWPRTARFESCPIVRPAGMHPAAAGALPAPP